MKTKVYIIFQHNEKLHFQYGANAAILSNWDISGNQLSCQMYCNWQMVINGQDRFWFFLSSCHFQAVY